MSSVEGTRPRGSSVASPSACHLDIPLLCLSRSSQSRDLPEPRSRTARAARGWGISIDSEKLRMEREGFWGSRSRWGASPLAPYAPFRSRCSRASGCPQSGTLQIAIPAVISACGRLRIIGKMQRCPTPIEPEKNPKIRIPMRLARGLQHGRVLFDNMASGVGQHPSRTHGAHTHVQP